MSIAFTFFVFLGLLIWYLVDRARRRREAEKAEAEREDIVVGVATILHRYLLEDPPTEEERLPNGYVRLAWIRRIMETHGELLPRLLEIGYPFALVNGFLGGARDAEVFDPRDVEGVSRMFSH